MSSEHDGSPPTPAQLRLRDSFLFAAARRGRAVPPRPPEPTAAVAPVARPIAFNGDLVAALLAGRKTQTRRPVVPAPAHLRRATDADAVGGGVPVGADGRDVACPFGRFGDRLWVRERWAIDAATGAIVYAADPGAVPPDGRWRPSRFMPRSASRISLAVTAVRCEPLDRITDAGARAEGWPGAGEPLAWFRGVWEAIYSAGAAVWEARPLVWVVEFERVTDDSTAGA